MNPPQIFRSVVTQLTSAVIATIIIQDKKAGVNKKITIKSNFIRQILVNFHFLSNLQKQPGRLVRVTGGDNHSGTVSKWKAPLSRLIAFSILAIIPPAAT